VPTYGSTASKPVGPHSRMAAVELLEASSYGISDPVGIGRPAPRWRPTPDDGQLRTLLGLAGDRLPRTGRAPGTGGEGRQPFLFRARSVHRPRRTWRTWSGVSTHLVRECPRWAAGPANQGTVGAGARRVRGPGGPGGQADGPRQGPGSSARRGPSGPPNSVWPQSRADAVHGPSGVVSALLVSRAGRAWPPGCSALDR